MPGPVRVRLLLALVLLGPGLLLARAAAHAARASSHREAGHPGSQRGPRRGVPATGAAPHARDSRQTAVRSGNGPVDSPDGAVHVLSYDGLGDITPASEDFSRAQAAPAASIVAPNASYLAALPADPAAKWIAATPATPPVSALYAVPFEVTDRVVGAAALDLAYAVDNALNGIYLNGQPISGDSRGGDYHVQFRLFRNDIGPLLIPNATNWLYLNVSDYGSISGLIFSARITTIGTNLVPDHGGTGGTVTVRITGSDFPAGPTAVGLRMPGQPPITGMNTRVVDAATVSTTFDLRPATPGVGDVALTLADGSTQTLPAAFTVEAGGEPELWVDIVASQAVRLGRPQVFTVVYGNRGNIDAYAVPLWLGGIPKQDQWELKTPLVTPTLGGSPPVDWSQVSIGTEFQDEVFIPLIVPVVAPDSTGTVDLALTPLDARAFRLSAWFTAPLLAGFPAAPGGGRARSSSQGMSDALAHCMSELGFAIADELADQLLGKECLDALAAFGSEELVRVVLGGDHLESLGQFQYGAVDVLIACAEFALPEEAILKKALEVFLDAEKSRKWATILSDCINALVQKTPDPEKTTPPIQVVSSFDPNDKTGLVGEGEARYVTGTGGLQYLIRFENLESATAPAREVTVTDQLDTSALDLDSLRFEQFSVGQHRFNLSGNVYQDEFDLRPALRVIMHVEASLYKPTGLLTWHFYSIDPQTGYPPDDPTLGFLPPNRNPPEGEGSLLFFVKPKAGLPSGTEIRNRARVVFDANPPIDTPEWLNTIDNQPPASRVVSATAGPSARFDLRWQGDDDRSGIRKFTVYVSVDGAPPVPQFVTAATSATYPGRYGHRYAFTTRAEDRTGNREPLRAAPDLVVHAPAATLDTLLAAVQTDAASGAIADRRLAQSLARPLLAGKEALRRGRRATVRALLRRQFLPVVTRWQGRLITLPAAADLTDQAAAVLRGL